MMDIRQQFEHDGESCAILILKGPSVTMKTYLFDVWAPVGWFLSWDLYTCVHWFLGFSKVMICQPSSSSLREKRGTDKQSSSKKHSRGTYVPRSLRAVVPLAIEKVKIEDFCGFPTCSRLSTYIYRLIINRQKKSNRILNYVGYMLHLVNHETNYCAIELTFICNYWRLSNNSFISQLELSNWIERSPNWYPKLWPSITFLLCISH